MASSLAFIKARDVLSELKGWLRDLDAEETAVANKERAIARQDSAQIIARALVRYGITINSGVQAAIDTMQKRQDRDGDTSDLAMVMSHLPQQWSTYRIALQRNGRGYFLEHSNETPDFMKLYFQSITFLTLWNDVWMKHVGLLGGREMTLLKSIQQWLLELDKPSAREALAEENAQLFKPPAQRLQFNSADIRDITAAAEEAVQAQEKYQAGIMTQLAEEVDRTHKLHIWFSQTEPEAHGAATPPGNVAGLFVLEDGHNKPVEKLKHAIRLWCKKILDREHLYDPTWIDQLIEGVRKKRDEYWQKFEQLFEDAQWRKHYKAHILADVRWMRALRLHTFFERIMSDELAPSPIKQIAIEAANVFSAQHVKDLQEKTGKTQGDFLAVQDNLMTHVVFHDTTRYQLWVLQTCAALTGKDNAKQHIKDYLAANCQVFAAEKKEYDQPSDKGQETPIDKAIARHATEPYQPQMPEMFCKALIKVKREKELMRADIHNRALGQVDEADRLAEDAATACKGIAEAIAELASKEKEDQRNNKITALKKQPPSPILLPLELFNRPLAAIHAKEGRRRLLPIFKFIEDKNILFQLSKQQIEKDAPATSVMPSTTIEMIRMATAADSSSFGQLIRYALWLTWVMHQDAVGNFRVPLTSDPRANQ